MASTGTVVTYPLLNLSLPDIGDPNSLAIADLSQYLPIPTSDQLSMQITPPGYPTVNVVFNPGQVNVYKCTDLGITCALTNCCPLVDGIYAVIYTVTIGSVNASLEKNFIRTTDLECKWMKAFAKIDSECNCSNGDQKKYKQELRIIELLINGGKAAANNCDISKAFTLYEKAENMLGLLACKFGLPCGTSFKCNSCGGCN